MDTILGLVMVYSWIHGSIIVAHKIHKPTTYETVVLWVGFSAFVLFVIGTLMA